MNWTKKLLVYEWPDLVMALSVTAGFWLVGEYFGWVLPIWDKTVTRIPSFGLLTGLIGGAITMTVCAVSRFGFEFGWLLQFGVPRRRQVVSQLAVQLLHGAAVVAFALLLGLVSRPLERLWYGGRLELVSLWEKLPLWMVPVLVAVPPLLGLFAGGVFKRFGRVGGYVLYFSFILLCLSTENILHGADGLVDSGFGLPLAVSAAVLLAVMAALGAHWLMTGDN